MVIVYLLSEEKKFIWAGFTSEKQEKLRVLFGPFGILNKNHKNNRPFHGNCGTAFFWRELSGNVQFPVKMSTSQWAFIYFRGSTTYRITEIFASSAIGCINVQSSAVGCVNVPSSVVCCVLWLELG